MNRKTLKGATASRSYRNRLKKLREGQREARKPETVERSHETTQAAPVASGGLPEGSYRFGLNHLEAVNAVFGNQSEAAVMDYFRWAVRVAGKSADDLPPSWADKVNKARQQVPVLRAYLLIRFGVVV